MTPVSNDDATLSVGSAGFSVIAGTVVPSDRAILTLLTAAPPVARWNGVEVRPDEVGDAVTDPNRSAAGIASVGVAILNSRVPSPEPSWVVSPPPGLTSAVAGRCTAHHIGAVRIG